MRIPLFLVLLSTACGYTDGGGGTRTLEVIAEIVYRTTDNEMDVEISVEKQGRDVNDATVELTDDEQGEKLVAEQADADVPYRLTVDGYRRRIDLLVESGADRVEGKLEGPGVHRVVHPENDAVLRRSDLGSTLEVRWNTEDGIAAQEVIIRADNFSHTIRDYVDPGHYEVPTSQLDNDNELAISVARINKVRLNGGIGESRMEIEYRARNTAVLE